VLTGIRSWLRGERKNGNAVRLPDWWSGPQTKAGAIVSAETALQVSTVHACVRVIADGVAQVPWKLYRSDGDTRVEARENPIYDLLHSRPNELQTSYEFRETVALHCVLTGNAFVYVSRVGDRVLELLPLEPGLMRIEAAQDAGSRPRYWYRSKSGEREILAADMWHLKGPSWTAVAGLEVVRLARESIGLAIATEEHGARLFSNGARPSGILSTDASLTADQQAAIRDQWLSTYGGANAGRTAILQGGLKWQQVTMDSDRSQFLETRRFQIEEICRAFRVMPIMVGYADKAATYASSEQMFLAHLVHTLGPWYARIEQSANAALLTPRERASGLYTKFVAQGLMRADARAQAEYISRMVLNGIMTRNEARGLLEMNPLAGLDEPLTPVNTDVGTTNANDAAPAPQQQEPQR
jgi:HK97 family phage portal protein